MRWRGTVELALAGWLIAGPACAQEAPGTSADGPLATARSAPRGAADGVPAGPPPVRLPRTEVRLLPSSRVEGVTYRLDIGLPRGYAEGSERYPVVYLLDSDYAFAIARNVVEHLADRDRISWAIVVGIGYEEPLRYRENRTRDYTPTHVPTGGYGPEYQRHSGGGPAFRAFLEEELVPFVDRTYRTTDERVLVGHSYGGLFGAWSALTAPALFDHHLLVSPSLWYDDGIVFEVEEAFARSGESPSGTLYLAVGAREGDARLDMVGDLRALGRRLERRGHPDLALRVEVLDGETHDSVFPRALSNGLRTIFGSRGSELPRDPSPSDREDR